MNAMVQHFHFEPGTQIAYDGYEVVVSGPVRGGIAVRDRFTGEGEAQRHFVISDQVVQGLLSRNDVVIKAEFNTDSQNMSGKKRGSQIARRKSSARLISVRRGALRHKLCLRKGPIPKRASNPAIQKSGSWPLIVSA